MSHYCPNYATCKNAGNKIATKKTHYSLDNCPRKEAIEKDQQIKELKGK
jgi:hypothetical protein